MNRFLPAVVFLVVAAIGLSMSMTLHNSAELAKEARIEALADEATDRIVGRFNQHLSLLQGTKSFFDATNGAIDRAAFRTYVAGLDTEGRYDGVQGIGFARFIRVGEEDAASAEIAASYDVRRAVWPQTEEPYRAVIVLLEPDDKRNRMALAYDMYSDPVRRTAMTLAFETGRPQASAPVELVQEITADKQAGFLVYIPFTVRGAEAGRPDRLPVNGFIYAPFRAGDLYNAAIDADRRLPVVIRAFDRDAKDTTLFQSPEWDDVIAKGGGYATTRETDVGGRRWVFEIHSTPAFRSPQSDIIPFIVGAVALLLAAALAASAQSQIKALAAARAVQDLSEKSLQEKDLMLQEMKHRIKNSIARMLAIARQTAASSADLEEFTASYGARLQAMATAQDVLTRSHWQRADLRELIGRELEQVFGDGKSHCSLSGPPVDLDEKATQAFSLTFHELATNALKYGHVAENGTELTVAWRLAGSGRHQTLHLEWREAGNGPVVAPTRKGFGTRLIDANIVGELNGRIDRAFGDDGLTVTIDVPLAPPPRKAKPD